MFRFCTNVVMIVFSSTSSEISSDDIQSSHTFQRDLLKLTWTGSCKERRNMFLLWSACPLQILVCTCWKQFYTCHHSSGFKFSSQNAFTIIHCIQCICNCHRKQTASHSYGCHSDSSFSAHTNGKHSNMQEQHYSSTNARCHSYFTESDRLLLTEAMKWSEQTFSLVLVIHSTYTSLAASGLYKNAWSPTH